jgi:hypothetical protein
MQDTLATTDVTNTSGFITAQQSLYMAAGGNITMVTHQRRQSTKALRAPLDQLRSWSLAGTSAHSGCCAQTCQRSGERQTAQFSDGNHRS